MSGSSYIVGHPAGAGELLDGMGAEGSPYIKIGVRIGAIEGLIGAQRKGPETFSLDFVRYTTAVKIISNRR